jgi:hypothetical protein
MIFKHGFLKAPAIAAGVALASLASAGGYMQEGFGRFGRLNEDGLLTMDAFPNRLSVTGLTIQFAAADSVPIVESIDTTAKTLRLTPETRPVGEAHTVHYTLLYPGMMVTFGSEARLGLSRATVQVEEVSTPGVPSHRGLLLRASSGSAMVPVGIAPESGVEWSWELVTSGGSTQLVITAPEPLGPIRFFTPNGVRTLSSSPSAGSLAEVRTRTREWLPRALPRLAGRAVTVDFDAGRVTLDETFEPLTSGDAMAPMPPVLAFALSKGWPATVGGDVLRSGFPTRYGEFAWLDGGSLVYTLPLPPLEERGLIRPVGRTAEINLLNEMSDRMGASWAVNAVDLAYAGMTPPQMAWPLLNDQKRSALTNAWTTYLPFAFRLPPYADSDPRKTWIRETEPLSGLQYWYTYFITGGPGGAYKLDLEWGNLLPIYGLAKYAQFSGDWDFVRQIWPIVREITVYTDYADDWAWMTNANGDLGWSTGTGDPMTAAYVGHVAALRMARILGDEEAAKHYAYRVARVAVPAVARFWYTDWAREQGFIGQNQIVQGFWERSTFTATTVSQTATDPWGPTNPLSGNGAQHEFFAALMHFAPEALRQHQDRMLTGYPNLFNPDYVYTINTTYGGNSVYVTFPHLYARMWLGESTEQLWTWLNACQSNRRTTGWIAANVIAELLARETPLILTEWAPVRWRDGVMTSASRVSLTFTAAQPQEWTMTARVLGAREVVGVYLDGQTIPHTMTGDELRVTAVVEGDFELVVEFDGLACTAEYIIDNETAASFSNTGPWSTSANAPFIGQSSLFAFGAAPANSATWSANLECSGLYDVYATWVAAPNRSAQAPYRINHALGSDVVLVDQRSLGNRWNMLGRYLFSSGPGASVVLTDEGVASDAIISADAVRLVLVEPLSDSASPGWLIR